jgi:leader peptidase (prepilin peptidase)/N-methyltransferase
VTADVLPPLAAILIAALLGLVFGSFLNVCIVRWGAEPKQSVVRPPSRCPRCGTGLRPYDNIPVVSWLLLRGKCRSCGLPISPMYPMVELATAATWAFMAWRYGATLHALSGAVFFTILLGIALTDLRAYLIPDEFSLGGLVLGLVLALAGGLGARRPAGGGAAGGVWLPGGVGWGGGLGVREGGGGGGAGKH